MIRPLVAAVALLALASCTGPRAPAPEPPAPASRFGAPIVERPRDVRPVAADPCRTILNVEAWRELGFSPDGVSSTVSTGEQSCQWNRPGTTEDIGVVVIPDQDTLVAAYRVRQFAVFQPTAIDGLPATREKTSDDALSCTITVGTAEGQGLMATLDGPLPNAGQPAVDPCDPAQRIVERIVQQLPPLVPGK